VRIALLDSDRGDNGDSPPTLDVEVLASLLVAEGHDVTALGVSFSDASSRGPGLEAISLWRPPRLRVQRFYENDIELAPSVVWRLVRGGFDIAHAFTPGLAWAAAQAQRGGGPPFVFSFRGLLERPWLVERHYRLEMMRATAAAASACTVESGQSALAFERYLLTPAQVVTGDEPGRFEGLYATAVAD
jgi:hypothetical protein